MSLQSSSHTIYTWLCVHDVYDYCIIRFGVTSVIVVINGKKIEILENCFIIVMSNYRKVKAKKIFLMKVMRT